MVVVGGWGYPGTLPALPVMIRVRQLQRVDGVPSEGLEGGSCGVKHGAVPVGNKRDGSGYVNAWYGHSYSFDLSGSAVRWCTSSHLDVMSSLGIGQPASESA